jgi:peptidoglycan/LPS O-acetylase OafA/YrhL
MRCFARFCAARQGIAALTDGASTRDRSLATARPPGQRASFVGRQIEDRAKIDSLDALRGILAVVVLLGHSTDVFLRGVDGLAPLAEAANKAAHSAVVCFFCLSGFVIALSIDINRQRGWSLLEFATTRAFRIVPPLVAVVALTWSMQVGLELIGLQHIAAADAERATFETAPLSQLWALVSLATHGDLTGANLNGPLWSLAYEIQLYVIAGLAAAALFGRTIAARLAAVLAGGLYLHAIGLWSLDFTSRITTMAAFGFGALAYVCRAARASAVGLITAAFAAAAAAAYVLAWRIGEGGDALDLLLTFELMMSGAFSALLVPLSRSGTLHELRRLGHFSYTLYIFHFPLLLGLQFALHGLAPGALLPAWAPLTWMVATAAVLAACAALGLWLEQPRAQRDWLRQWRTYSLRCRHARCRP